MSWGDAPARPLEPMLDEIEGRRKRALREILTAKENLADPHLDERSARDLRAIVVDQVNALAYTAQNQVRAAYATLPASFPTVDPDALAVRPDRAGDDHGR